MHLSGHADAGATGSQPRPRVGQANWHVGDEVGRLAAGMIVDEERADPPALRTSCRTGASADVRCEV